MSDDLLFYPSLSNTPQNSYYCGIIQSIFAGSESELSAFLQLRFQSYALSNSSPDIAEKLNKIAFQDLKHQELLANAIFSLGGKPFYFNAQGKWFSGKNIDYFLPLKQLIALDIELKEKLVLDYRLAIQKISNTNLSAFLERIVKDEQNHLDILNSVSSSFVLS